MKPADEATCGRSAYSLAKDAEVHLKIVLDFLGSGGCPQNFDAETQQYNREQLQRLATWIDDQELPPSASLRVIQEMTEELSSTTTSRSSTPRTSDDGIFRSSKIRAPTVLDSFLETVDKTLLSCAGKLVEQARRPGDFHEMTLAQLVECGVKKLKARKLKNHPWVHFDAERIRRGESPFTGRNAGGAGTVEEEVGDEDEEEDDESKANEGTLRTRRMETDRDLENFLERIDSSFVGYANSLRMIGITRPGDLASRKEQELVATASVRKIHARRILRSEEVYLDAEKMEA